MCSDANRCFVDFARIRAVDVKVRVKEREGWIGGRRGMVKEVTPGVGSDCIWRQSLVPVETDASILSLRQTAH